MGRSALCSLLLWPFGLESVTIFDHVLLYASPSQKSACGFPAQASSYGHSPHGSQSYQPSWSWKGVSATIPTEAFPREAASLAAAVERPDLVVSGEPPRPALRRPRLFLVRRRARRHRHSGPAVGLDDGYTDERCAHGFERFSVGAEDLIERLGKVL